ncbi:HAD-IIIA family hydrolase [Allochromatium warmingii]|nr:HAD-IIIA family hydrolase [Allochromatium warmingii]
MRQALILVGGQGTRLGDLTANLPKPMLDIGGRPFLQRLIEEVARHGFQDILLLCGYLADRIVDAFDGVTLHGARVRCIIEPQPLGTGGALRQAADRLDDRFLLLNGDSLFDFNLLDLQRVADDADWLGIVALRALSDTGRYGRVTLAGNRITAFAEKQGQGAGVINGGVYLLRRQVLDAIQGLPCSLEQAILPRLAAENRLFGRVYQGYFIDIGIPADLQRAQVELAQRRRPALFFDRDGVLNRDAGYTHRVEDFHWMPTAMEAIKHCNDQGWLVIVVTNQAGIARGFYDAAAVERLHEWIQTQLRAIGAHVDAFYYCPHHPEGSVPELSIPCHCRKPEPGMLLRAMEDWPVDRSRAFLIGDQASDIEAATSAGITGLFCQNGVLLDLVRGLVD